MCTFQFSNRSVIATASHSGTRRNIGLQRVEANGLALSTRFSVYAVTLNRLIADVWTEAGMRQNSMEITIQIGN